MRRHGPWRVLGLDPTDDRTAIRRAYADKLRGLDVDRDVAGYARLRGARDHALALARSQAVADADACEPVGTGAGLAEAPPQAAGDEETVASAPAPPETAAEPEPPSPPQVLLAILFPQGEASEAPLTAEEQAEADRMLAAILEHAETSTIDEQAGIEDWLAHHLASAWPRSAWLVEDASRAFSWTEESGRLSERPAVQFLNQRLKGMQFTARVQQPGHPLHKAWLELSRPGEKGAFAFLRAGKSDVQMLLNGIRERYPEVEGHLDPVRVASWDAASEVTPSSAWTSFMLLAGAAALVRVCAGDLDMSPPPPAVAAPPTISTPGSAGWPSDERTLLIAELFGEPILPDTLRNEAPDLWTFLETRPQASGPFPSNIDAALPSLVQQVRLHTQVAAIDAGFESLVAIKQLKLDLMRIASERMGSEACLEFARTLRFPLDIEVPAGLRDRERKVAARLVEDGLFRPINSEFPQTARIPGSVVEEVARSTGFSEETMNAAAQNRGSAAIQCEYRITLLEAILRRPGEVPGDLLRMM